MYHSHLVSLDLLNFFFHIFAVSRVSLTQSLYETDEDEGNATVCTELLFGILERNVVVTLNTEDITAMGNVPYTSYYCMLQLAVAWQPKFITGCIQEGCECMIIR